MQDTLIDQGFNLMLFGMGTVFVFLTILVFATTFMSKLVNRFAISNDSQTSVDDSSVAPLAAQPSPQIMAAIESAIAEHRKR